MDTFIQRPAFGKPRMSPGYFDEVDQIIATLRDTATLNAIAMYLNKCNFTTPTGMDWDRNRLSSYIYTRARTTTTKE